MSTDILSIATAKAGYSMSQEEIGEKMIDSLSLKGMEASKIRRIYKNSAIEKRHTVRPFNEELFSHLHNPPKPTFLNTIYKKEAPKLAYTAACEALKRWGGNRSEITHVISASCTGMYAPGLEYLLMDTLGLPRTVGRYGINFMGCFGAFKGLGLADSIAKEDKRHRVLVVCTELCSLHVQTQNDLEAAVSNAIFADGAAAAVVGQQKGLLEIVKKASLGVPYSQDKMSWDMGDHGFVMRLKKDVPELMGQTIPSFVKGLALEEKNIDWAIHPGGKAILEQIEKGLSLSSEQTMASWNTLKNYGNMSSATFLFVLEELLRLGTKNSHCIGLAMGPGLSIEGMLFKNR